MSIVSKECKGLGSKTRVTKQALLVSLLHTLLYVENKSPLPQDTHRVFKPILLVIPHRDAVMPKVRQYATSEMKVVSGIVTRRAAATGGGGDRKSGCDRKS